MSAAAARAKAARLLLLAGEGEGQRCSKRRLVRAVGHVGHRLAPGAAARPLLHEEQLEHEQLLVGQAPTRLGHLRHGLGEVDARERRPAAHQTVLLAQGQGQRIVEPPHRGKRVLRQPPHPRRRELLGGRVHGDDHGRHLALPHLLQVGVGHALEAVVELHLAGHGHRVARLHLIHEPRLAEARHHEGARAVHERQLHERQVGPRALEFDLVDGAADGARLADARVGYRAHGRQVHVAPREVGHQVADGADAQLLEGLGASGAHQAHPADGLVEGKRGRQTIRRPRRGALVRASAVGGGGQASYSTERMIG